MTTNRWMAVVLLAALAGCENGDYSSPPQARSQDGWDDTACAINMAFGSVGTVLGNSRYISVEEAKQWCRAQRLGLPYSPIRGNSAPSYRCMSYDGLTTTCRPM